MSLAGRPSFPVQTRCNHLFTSHCHTLALIRLFSHSLVTLLLVNISSHPLSYSPRSIGGFNVNTTVSNATWRGNNFSGSGSFMGNRFTATGTFTAPSTVSGKRCSAPVLHAVHWPHSATGQVCNPTRGCTSFSGQTR